MSRGPRRRRSGRAAPRDATCAAGRRGRASWGLRFSGAASVQRNPPLSYEFGALGAPAGLEIRAQSARMIGKSAKGGDMRLLTSAFLCIFILSVGAEFLFSALAGLPGTIDTTRSAALSGIFVFIGITSSIIFDRFDGRLTTRRKLFRRNDMILASVLAPIVMLSFYPVMRDAQDPLLGALLAYQNGFFFQTVIARVKGQHNEQAS